MSGAQPPRSSRTIAQWLPGERRGAERDALDRQVRAQLVDRRELGLDVGPQLLLGLGHGRPLGVVVPAGSDGVQHVGGDRRAQPGVEAEQLEQDGGARAGRPGDDDRRLDHLLGHRRVAPPLLAQEEPGAQPAEQLLAGHQPPDDVEVAAVDGVDEGRAAAPPSRRRRGRRGRRRRSSVRASSISAPATSGTSARAPPDAGPMAFRRRTQSGRRYLSPIDARPMAGSQPR